MAECPENRLSGMKTFEFAGFQFPLSSLITAESIQKYFAVRTQPNDVFISSYPKCDSNSVDLILWNLLFPEQKVQELNNLTNRHLPCMEMTIAEGYLKNMLQQAMKYNKPRLFKTYLPFRLIPIYKRAKYIYVVRTPWDVCASYYRFLRQLECVGDSFEDFSEDFLAGNVAYGSIFDHVEPWVKLVGTDNILIISYEHVQHNPRSAMFTIAAFLGDMYLKNLADIPDYENNILRSLNWDQTKKCTSDQTDPPLVKTIADAVLLKEKSGVKVIKKPTLTFSQLKIVAEKVSETFPGVSIEQLWLNLLKKKLAMLSKE
ncbi:sulfotransferase 1C4-like [Uloborus diversus]|uniref:sulfotransferase 1C4-like n=1 Tax=Uloborus diversus TaxID=327109 RepID=UPI002408F480|nr:sulfotransferase 1C4-like [Uloborus diversus]